MASDLPGTHAARLADCSKTVPGRIETIWTGIEAKPYGSHSMVESRIYSDEHSEWPMFDFC